MNNPFEAIETRLNTIESLLLDIKHSSPIEALTEPKDELLTVQEAAKFLKLTVPTIYSKVSRNELPVMKKGKRLYFSQKELLEYLQTGRKKTNTEIAAEADAYLSNTQKKVR